jgi:hypothetical protein
MGSALEIVIVNLRSHTPFEAGWQPKVQQAGWTRIQPMAAQTKGSTNVGHLLGEEFGQMGGLPVGALSQQLTESC